MHSRSPSNRLFLSVLALAVLSVPARADEMSPEQRKAVQKGLEWLAKNQHKDGHWEAFGGQYPVTMTGICRHGPAHGRQHHPRGQVQGQHPPRRRLADGPLHAQRHARQSQHPRRGRPLHVRPRLRHALPLLRRTARKRKATAAADWRTFSNAPASSRTRPRPTAAAGATSRRARAATSTKAR